MKKLVPLLLAACLTIGCSAPSVASRETSSLISVMSESSSPVSSQISQPISSAAVSKKSLVPSSISSAESGPALTGIDLYMKCFNEGKYDIYNLKIGDPIQNAIDEFGPGEKKYYGLGGDCYDFGGIVTSFADGTESYENKVIDFDIVGDGITVFGLTTGLSTIADVKKIFGEPKEACDVGRYSYESIKTFEDSFDEGEKYYFIQYTNENKEFWCAIDFFFEYGVLRVISLGKIGALYPN